MKTMSAKEKCVALYHQELAAENNIKLLVDPFKHHLAQRLGVDVEDLSDSDVDTLIKIGKAMAWSRSFDLIARALAQAYESSIDHLLRLLDDTE